MLSTEARSVLIFKTPWEDFFKIFLPTLLVFALFAFPSFYTSSALLIFSIFFLDCGHVFSTFLELYVDPVERKKPYVWQLTLFALAMNLFMGLLYEKYFFTYLFYFSVFHNMRQGLGVTLLYRREDSSKSKLIKYSYYFLTFMPFFLFHLKERPLPLLSLGESIIRPLNLQQSHHLSALFSFYKFGLGVFIIGVVGLCLSLIFKKETKGILAMGFYALIYTFAFILSENESQTYLVLIISHAIPYFWLMQKRLVATHSSKIIKQFALVFLFMTFLAGAVMNYGLQDFIHDFKTPGVWGIAILYTPLIAHFLFDGAIWSRDNRRFQLFLRH